MLLRTAGIVASILTASLLTACYEGNSAELSPRERTVTAQDLDVLAPGALLELDLAAEAVRFAFVDGPIDFTRVVIVAADGRRALMQDLLASRAEAWGVTPGQIDLDASFVVDAAALAAPTTARPGQLQWAQQSALQTLPRVDSVIAAADGVPVFLAGDLGMLPKGEPRAATAQFLRDLGPVFRIGAHSELEPVRSRSDELGHTHVRFQQYLHDLPVVGGELTVHADGLSGRVHAVTGRFIAGDDLASEPAIEGEAALAGVVSSLAADAISIDVPDLVYVVTDLGAQLAWSAEVQYTSAEGPERDIVFVDAVTGALVTRHPQHHRALKRYVYTANNGQQLPGQVLIQEGGSSADLSAQDAYKFAGITYDFYKAKFQRDSFNAAGAALHATVHYGQQYVNAFWDGQQMVYGDGDGVWAGSFSRDADIVVHELTHAVTQYEANLVYQDQSGALNEAFSDIMAAAADAHVNGGVRAATWNLAETIWTPGTAGDAMRYMNDPIKDGQSYDYYPTRYIGGQDNGGVHLNSGIANLAFYLLSQGGKHPRGKTVNVVPALGVDKAAAIFYRALANFLGANATFQDARNATAQAATELYGADAATATHAAWTAVGVPGAPNGGGGGDGGGACVGTPYPGSLGGTGATQWQPNNTYYSTAATAKHSGCLTGPVGTDFDLELFKWNGGGWLQVAKSDGPTNQEAVAYTGSAGYYTWRISSADGSGAYTMTLQVQ